MFLLDRGQNEIIEDVLEPALTDSEFLDEVKEALSSAPLPTATRRQLTEGLNQRDRAMGVGFNHPIGWARPPWPPSCR